MDESSHGQREKRSARPSRLLLGDDDRYVTAVFADVILFTHDLFAGFRSVFR